jgi:hypothetical protein
MLKIFEKIFQKLHKQRDRLSRLNVLEKLIIMLGTNMMTVQNIAIDYGVLKSRVCDAVKWIEETLIKDGAFSCF